MKSINFLFYSLIPLGFISGSVVAAEMELGYHSMELDGLHFEKGSRSALLLEEIARYRGRDLTVDEVAELRAPIHRITGERPVRSPDHGGWCFTGECRILTPKGYRRIRDLLIGDEVLSVDVHTGRLIANPIVSISRTENQKVGELKTSGSLGASIEVSPAHLFFSPSVDNYLAISKLEAESDLLRVRTIDGIQAELTSIQRGSYDLLAGLRTVYNLHLKFKPHNFCVESLVVHNMAKEM